VKKLKSNDGEPIVLKKESDSETPEALQAKKHSTISEHKVEEVEEETI